MKVKTKKENEDGMVRLETSGKVMEVMVKEDLLNPKAGTVEICFRGKRSSGIIEMTPKEIESIYKNVSLRLQSLKNVKVMKFEK